MTTGKNKIIGLKNIEKVRGPMTFARLLQSYRLTQEFSQEELGEKVGLSKANVCDLEKGRRIPTAVRAKKMAKALGEIESYWIEVALQDMLRSEHINLIVKIEPGKKAS